MLTDSQSANKNTAATVTNLVAASERSEVERAGPHLTQSGPTQTTGGGATIMAGAGATITGAGGG